MKNYTKSEIVISMSHIDNANRLFKFLKNALKVGDMGGDLLLTYDGAEKNTFKIGHDVKCKNVKHVIYEK